MCQRGNEFVKERHSQGEHQPGEVSRVEQTGQVPYGEEERRDGRKEEESREKGGGVQAGRESEEHCAEHVGVSRIPCGHMPLAHEACPVTRALEDCWREQCAVEKPGTDRGMDKKLPILWQGRRERGKRRRNSNLL